MYVWRAVIHYNTSHMRISTRLETLYQIVLSRDMRDSVMTDQSFSEYEESKMESTYSFYHWRRRNVFKQHLRKSKFHK